MGLGKFLSSLTKPELEELESKCLFNDCEKIIVKMICNDNSYVEIARELCVSVPTVSRRIKRLKEKMGRCDLEMESKIPIWEKMNLTMEEASEYSNIGINKMYEIANNPMCPFVLYVGKRRLIKRKEFEKFIEKSTEL